MESIPKRPRHFVKSENMAQRLTKIIESSENESNKNKQSIVGISSSSVTFQAGSHPMKISNFFIIMSIVSLTISPVWYFRHQYFWHFQKSLECVDARMFVWVYQRQQSTGTCFAWNLSSIVATAEKRMPEKHTFMKHMSNYFYSTE